MTHEEIKNNPVRVKRTYESFKDEEGLLCEYRDTICFLHSKDNGDSRAPDVFSQYKKYRSLTSYSPGSTFDLSARGFTVIGSMLTATDMTFRKPYKMEI